jgi:hypothetical protein
LAIALNAGIDAVKIPILISITLQYIGPDMVQVESLEKSMPGMYVILIMDETQVLTISVSVARVGSRE